MILNLSLPGGGIIGGPKPPPLPAPPPPPPTRADPAIAARSAEVALAEKKRKGRGASLVADAEEGLGEPFTERPAAREGSKLLG